MSQSRTIHALSTFAHKSSVTVTELRDYITTLQMFTGNYRVFAGKSECRDFKFIGIACIPAIPVI